MLNTRFLLTIALAILMIAAGITHFLKTRLYLRIVPQFLPLRIPIVQLSGLIELAAGIGLCIPAYRYRAATLVLLLMIVFLPLHIWDVFRERPAMGSRQLAWIRLPIQFLLIAWAWYVRG
jgi:uncharacterized membrane protein